MRVGDYVRTKNYGIAKILNIYNNTTTNYSSITLDKIDSFGRLGVSITLDNIIGNPSEKPIDLIEVGDYVNGYMVENTDAGLNGDVIEIATGTNYFQSPSLYEEDIKSIVTHEQFERIEYKVK